VSVLDEAGRLVMVNKKLAQELDYPNATALLADTQIANLARFKIYDMNGKPIQHTDLPFRDVLEQDRTIEVNFRAVDTRTNTERWQLMRASPVHDARGKPYLVVRVVQDVTQIRRIEQIEHDANQLLRDLMDNVRTFMSLITPDGKVLEVNKAALELGGLKRDAVIGTDTVASFWWGYSPESQQFIQWAIERGRSGASVRLDTKIRVAGGKLIDIDFMIAPIYDKDGNVKNLILSGTDISDRKKKERELHELNQQIARERTRLKTIVESVPGLIWEGYGPPGEGQTFVPVNDFSTQLLGYPAQAWRDDPKLWYKLINPDDLAITMPQTQAIYESGQSGIIEFRATHRDGHTVYLEARTSILKDENGQAIGACGVFMDITERKQREEELRALNAEISKQQARMQLVYENVPGVIWEIHQQPDGKTIEYANDYTQAVLGYPSKSWQENENFWSKIVHPDDLDKTNTYAREVVETGKMGHYEFRAIHRDGHIVPMEAHVSLLRNESGVPVGMISVVMDMTERKRYEDQLSEGAEALRRSNAELEMFAYLASHDLQEPLRMITSYLQLLVQRYGDRFDGDAREFIDFAVDGSQRMKALINDLLAYSRIQRGEWIASPVDLQKTFEHAMRNLQGTVDDTHAEVTHDPLPDVQGNKSQLVQVFQNLIANALKFRRENAPPRIHISVREDKKEWVFSVSDNGIGIDNQYLDRIFVIFQRLHNHTKYAGTGIGLAICKRIIENHHGRIWAESTVGVGTTIYFTLPC
jgi:PAS domain S-box-containing protein